MSLSISEVWEFLHKDASKYNYYFKSHYFICKKCWYLQEVSDTSEVVRALILDKGAMVSDTLATWILVLNLEPPSWVIMHRQK